MGKDIHAETMAAIEKAVEPVTEEELAAFKKQFEGMSKEEIAAKIREDNAITTGKRLRRFAYAGKEICIPKPSELAIFKAYPHVSENPFVTLLTLGFNKVVNKRREKEFEEKDKNDFAATGTTRALEISKMYKELDRVFIDVLKGS